MAGVNHGHSRGGSLVQYPDDLAMHNPRAAYGTTAASRTDMIMVQNPVAVTLADESAELPNLTEHVPVEEVVEVVANNDLQGPC